MRIIDLHCYPNTQPWIDCQGPYVKALAEYWNRRWTAKEEGEVIAEFDAAGVEAVLVALDLEEERLDLLRDAVERALRLERGLRALLGRLLRVAPLLLQVGHRLRALRLRLRLDRRQGRLRRLRRLRRVPLILSPAGA